MTEQAASQNKAMVIEQFGDTTQLKQFHLPVMAPNDNQVLIKIHNAAINPIDVKTRAGIGFAAAQNKEHLPIGLGYDVCGQIVAVGAAVSEFSIGEVVMGMVGFPLSPGCYQDYRLADRSEIISGSSVQDFSSMSGLCLSGLTALQGLRLLTEDLHLGAHIYINAAGGGVGHLALQIARNLGFEVTAIVSNPDQTFVRSLASYVVSYEQFVEANDAQALFDVAGGARGLKCIAALKTDSQVVTVPTVTAQECIDLANSMNIACQGMLVSSNTADLTQLFLWYQEGQLKLHIDSQFTFSDVAKAHNRVESGLTQGKVILVNSNY
ncbi:NADPH2:quinone reductase [Pseudoalteromonas ulvae UL12]|uniref:NADP-dependent oxidoreductase n=1 Tax=Pseudoalteromonas ulvae TaxID=107327 RepID=UPI00186B9580|nr:NADP-dependent oxidoreductase [Pseudoalteromonas ulvae]MBE0362625.1 NADPH2:quinone reductase [Pseudoalteromonas ulvae UL12]